MNLDLLSKYRVQLMGIAMLLVIVYHAAIDFKISILNFIGNQGYIGVDIFLMLSGLGMYFSLSQTQSIKEFYYKRFIKIYPSYILAILIFGYINHLKIIDIILIITTLSFWLNLSTTFNWYIPALVFFYLLTPLYIPFFKKSPYIITFTVCVISGILSMILPLYLFNLTTRIPIFCIGILIGYLIYNKINIPFKFLGIVSFIVGLIWFYANIKLWKIPQFGTLPFALIIPFLCIIIAKGLTILKYNYVLTFFGKYSLTLYLFYDMTADYCIRINKQLYSIIDINLYPRWCSELLVLLITCIIAYLVQKLVDLLITKNKIAHLFN